MRDSVQTATQAQSPQRIEVVLQPAVGSSDPDWLGAVTDLFWPLATLMAVIVLRTAIADALRGLGARAKSLSLGVIGFDFGDAAVKGLTPESLDDIRHTASHTPVGDSGAALTATLTDPSPAECTVVELGTGREWITSRLYAVVTLTARMRGLRVVVFTASGTRGREFIGSAAPEDVRWALAAAYPWLEAAYVRAQSSQLAALDVRTLERRQLSLSKDGRVEPWSAVQLFEAYKRELQAPVAPPAASGWLDLAGVWERAEWVTPALLAHVLGECLHPGAVQDDFDTPADELARRVLRFPLDYVPTVDRTGNFLRDVARREYALRTLKQVADQ